MTGVDPNQIMAVTEIPWPGWTLNGWAYSKLMNWVYAGYAPWSWCMATECWSYIPSETEIAGFGWVYIPNHEPLGLEKMWPELWPDAPWFSCSKLGKDNLYVDPNGSGWVYFSE